MITAARDYASEHPDSSVELVVFALFTSADHTVFKKFAES
jgi:hypothetical protein